MTVVQHPTPAPQMFTGLSTDTKPTVTANPGAQAVVNNAIFYATDTGAWYIYSSSAGWQLSSQATV